MKTSIKDIIIGIFAIIGFYAVVTGFNSPQETQGEQPIITVIPESHEWEIKDRFMWNKKSGEVRKLSADIPTRQGIYVTLNEKSQ